MSGGTYHFPPGHSMVRRSTAVLPLRGCAPVPAEPTRWWSLRPAQSPKPATYRCPLCGKHLPALSEHVLIWPEGDKSRRRHAHTACVRAAREAGRLPSEEEWRRTQPRSPSAWMRLRARFSSR